MVQLERGGKDQLIIHHNLGSKLVSPFFGFGKWHSLDRRLLVITLFWTWWWWWW